MRLATYNPDQGRRELGLGLGMVAPAWQRGGTDENIVDNLLGEAYFLNDLTPTSTPATNASHPWYQSGWSSGQRRRVPFRIGRRTVLGDLIEGSRASLIGYTNWTGAVAGTPGTQPSGWSFGFNTGAISAVADATVSGAKALTFTVSASRHVLQQSITLPATGTVVGACRVVANSGLVVAQLMSGAALPSGASESFRINGVAVLSTAVPVAGDVIEHVITLGGTGGAYNARFGAGTGSNSTGSATLEEPQYTTGPFASSFIPCATTPVTRGADSLTVSLASLPGGGLSTVNGTLLALLVPYGWTGDQDGSTYWRVLNDPGAGNALRWLRSAATTMLLERKDGGTQATSPAHGLTSRALRSIAQVYDATSLRGFVNGAAAGTPDTSLSPPYGAVTDLNLLGIGASYSFFGAGLFPYWPRALTAAELAALHRQSLVTAPLF